jgi:hypothetical protein
MKTNREIRTEVVHVTRLENTTSGNAVWSVITMDGVFATKANSEVADIAANLRSACMADGFKPIPVILVINNQGKNGRICDIVFPFAGN